MSSSTLSVDATTPLLQSVSEAAGRYVNGEALPKSEPERAVQKWHNPIINAWRILAAFFSFIVVGANDAIYGALVPYLCDHYGLDYASVSMVFLFPCLGYVAAALVSNWIHARFGQRGVAFLGSGFHVLAYTIAIQHPPYPVLVVLFVLAGLGSGLLDAAWNAWIGVMEDSSQLMGILHGFYGLGAALAPLTATSLITHRGWHWYQFYYIMAGGSIIEILALTTAFWSARGSPVTKELHTDRDAVSWWKALRASPTIQSLSYGATWIICLFIFLYAGVEITFGGWVFTFLVRERVVPPFAAGIANFVYWAGLTVGRVLLGFVTSYLNIGKYTVLVYVTACIICHITFWLVKEFTVSVVAVALLGFFLGPLFPEAVIAFADLLPKHLHISGIGIAVALGSAGGCVFPFITGALAKLVGLQILQPMVLLLLLLCLSSWVLFLMVSRRQISSC